MPNKCLLLVSAVQNKLSDLQGALRLDHVCVPLTLEKFSQGSVIAVDGIIIDVDMKNITAVDLLRQSLKNVDRDRTFVVLFVDRDRPADMTEALELGADEIIHRSSRDPQLNHLSVKAAAKKINQLVNCFEFRAHQPKILRQAIQSGDKALGSIYNFAITGQPIELQDLKNESSVIIDALYEHGLDSWIDLVRTHHSATYQHSLLVTGVATAFGQALGCNAKDLERLSVSAMLHDIGKSKISVDILEKPGPLTDAEWIIMKQHPTYGREIIQQSHQFEPEILDIVTHHHEYLDGSGYPDNLSGRDISDIVRMMTISDIFGALLERRSYKKEKTPQEAYDILASMTTKLEMPLVQAFNKILDQFKKAA